MKFHIRLMSNRRFSPTRFLALGFAGIILLGAGLLSLPVAARDGGFTPWLTCLFTAASATCVTGLVVVDTSLHWSGFGQGVLLCLLQLGGLGFISLITLVSLALRRSIISLRVPRPGLLLHRLHGSCAVSDRRIAPRLGGDGRLHGPCAVSHRRIAPCLGKHGLLLRRLLPGGFLLAQIVEFPLGQLPLLFLLLLLVLLVPVTQLVNELLYIQMK